jgi:hypothetical protein
MPKYRFFYHYFKARNRMTVHFRGVCRVVEHVECRVPCETKWSATQPRLRMQGFAERVEVHGTTAVIQ